MSKRHEAFINPELLINELNNNPDENFRQDLILFAEINDFKNKDQIVIFEHLLQFIKDYKNTKTEKEITVLGSACRKLGAYLPINRFDDYLKLLEGKLEYNFQLEIIKGLYYRLMWDKDVRNQVDIKVQNKLFEMLNALFNEYDEKNIHAAIMKNICKILSLTNYNKLNQFLDNLPQSMSWFLEMIITSCELELEFIPENIVKYKGVKNG